MTPDDPPRDDAPPADDPAGIAMVGQPKLGRIGLIIWLGLPILIVIGLWFMMDRSRGQPRPDMSGALGPGQRAPTGGEAQPP